MSAIQKRIKRVPSNIIDDISMVCYEIKNNITGDCYAGMTTRKLIKRINQHEKLHSKKGSSNSVNRTLMYVDFEKYGIDNFSVRILKQCKTKLELLEYEKEKRLEPQYSKYSFREKTKNTSKKHKLTKVLLTDLKGNELLFSRSIYVARFCECDRSNVTKALKGQYRLKRKYKAEYITDEIFKQKTNK
jgi:hypothetical protein